MQYASRWSQARRGSNPRPQSGQSKCDEHFLEQLRKTQTFIVRDISVKDCKVVDKLNWLSNSSWITLSDKCVCYTKPQVTVLVRPLAVWFPSCCSGLRRETENKISLLKR